MENNKEIMFEKFFDGIRQELIKSFKALGEEKILDRILENQNENKNTCRAYFNCAWEFLETTKIAEQQAKVEELKKQLIKHGLICPMCGVTELKEEVFLNDEVECLISKCAECGIETASSAQLKINKLTFSGRELQQKLQMALDVIECGKGVRGIFVQKFNAQQERIDAALKLIKDRSFWVMRNGCYEDVVIKEQIEQALKGEG
ncbi:hypothetical protein QZK48_08315 [Acinetobacter baumannii]|nr:hypothetical protein [Acinetobacter baumannii]